MILANINTTSYFFIKGDFLIKQIKKRNGSIVLFQPEKIEEAIWKAVKSVGGTDREKVKEIAKKVVIVLENKFPDTIPNVEDIQDSVEKTLIEEGHAKTAKAYILYRKAHQEIREATHMFDSIKAVDDYVSVSDWLVNENSNMGFSLQGLNNYLSTKIISHYWLKRIYPEAVRKAHEEVDLHIHDLGTLGAYCVGWDLQDLLKTGFQGVSGKVASKPAKHFRTALGQMVNFFYTLQGESAGAQAFANVDTLLAPFIKYDNLDYNEVKQSIQEFVFNLAVPTRVGFQSPFTNITLDLKVPDILKKEKVIIGGVEQKETYGDFQNEVTIFNKAFAEVMCQGDAEGRVFTFPIPTYNITKDFDWDNEDYNSIWEMTGKYGIPYFSNFVNSDMSPDDARSMCLHGDEEILVKIDGKLERTTMKCLIETYGGEGWNKCNHNIKVLSLDEDYKLRWSGIKNFLKVKKKGLRSIITKDGKMCKLSMNHPVMVLTEDGLKQKFASDLKINDYMISLKSAEGLLSKKCSKFGSYVLNKDLAFFFGFFTADGNYLYKSKTKITRGMQLSFNAKNKDQIDLLKGLIYKLFKYKAKEKKDPRYNTYYLYIYNSNLANLSYNFGFKKYGRLPNILFNSPKEVIESFLKGFFLGDGYAKRNEIHINDNLLIRDLTLLYSLIGLPNILKIKERSQRLYLNKKTNNKNVIGCVVNCLNELIPGFLAKSTYLVPGLNKNRMVGQLTLQKYNAETLLSRKILESDIYPVRVVEIQDTAENIEDFYDIELERDHIFVHSLGTLTHNCCRLRIDQRELKRRGGGLFGASPKTGSLGVVTLNMPRIGFISVDENEFFLNLSNLMELAKESLEIKRKAVESFTEKGLYPYSKFYLRSIKEDYGKYWKNHFSTIGILGMNEAIVNFMPGENIATPSGSKFAIKVLDFMRSKLGDFQEETGNLYNLEATPGESTTHRFALADKKRFVRIKVANDEDVRNGAKPFYTNSTHLPVNYSDDLFEVLELQDPLQVKYTGGTVIHGFVGERLEANMVKELVRKITSNFHLPYFTLTPTFSICPKHSYLEGDHEYCPKCDIEIGYKGVKNGENKM